MQVISYDWDFSALELVKLIEKSYWSRMKFMFEITYTNLILETLVTEAANFNSIFCVSRNFF